MRTLRVFVSSPGDVGRERIVAGHVFRRLAGKHARRVILEPYLWEQEPMRASDDFQHQIPSSADFDIVITILWSRLGSPLNERYRRANGTLYLSGTEYEFELAKEASVQHGVPELLIYRNKETPLIPPEPEEVRVEKISQWQALKNFIEHNLLDAGGRVKIAWNDYHSLGEFEEKLESDLDKLIVQLVPHVGGEAMVRKVRRDYARGSPFRQLRAFAFEDAEIFFGRVRAIDEVLRSLRDQAATGCAFTLVFGSSGSGKSSLAHAGVLPMLVSPGVIDGIGLWRWASVRPSEDRRDPFLGLATALLGPGALGELATLSEITPAELARTLREGPAGLALIVRSGLAEAARETCDRERLSKPPQARLALVIDQFEEIFSVGELFDQETRRLYVTALGELARSGVVWILATLRSEFFSRCDQIPELVRMKSGRGQVQLLPMTEMELRQIIRLPAEAAGLEFEVNERAERLDDLLLDAARKQSGSLPLIEFALEELYRARREDVWLTHDAFQRMTGLEGAMQLRADAIYRNLSATAQAACPALFRALATPDLGDPDTFVRRIARTDDWPPDGARAEAIGAFVEAHLLVSDRDRDGGATLEVAHEALFSHWAFVRDLLTADRAFLLLRAQAAAGAGVWRAHHGERSFLWWNGQPLAEARTLHARRHELSPAEGEFVDASLAEGRKSARRRLVVQAALFVLIVALGTGGYFWWRQRESLAEVRAWRSQLAATPATDRLTREDLSQRVLAIDPTDSDAHKVQAETALERQDFEAFDRAMAEWRRRVDPPPRSFNLLQGDGSYARGEKAEAVALWTTELSQRDLAPSLRKATLPKLAAALGELDRWDEARETLSAWIKLEDTAVARLRRAEAHRHLRQWREEEEDKAAAHRIDPQLPQPAQASSGQEVQALEALNEQVRKSPRDPARRQARATELMRQGKWEAALEDIQKIRLLLPDAARPALEEAHALWQLGREIPAEQGVAPAAWWVKAPEDGAASLLAKLTALEALGGLDAQLDEKPDDPALHAQRAAALESLGAPTLAARDRERAKPTPP